MSTPMRLIRSPCCARAASGHTAAVAIAVDERIGFTPHAGFENGFQLPTKFVAQHLGAENRLCPPSSLDEPGRTGILYGSVESIRRRGNLRISIIKPMPF